LGDAILLAIAFADLYRWSFLLRGKA